MTPKQADAYFAIYRALKRRCRSVGHDLDDCHAEAIAAAVQGYAVIVSCDKRKTMVFPPTDAKWVDVLQWMKVGKKRKKG